MGQFHWQSMPCRSSHWPIRDRDESRGSWRKMRGMKRFVLLPLLMALTTVAGGQQAPVRLESTVIDWTTLKPAPTQKGQRREVFDAPTATLDKLHGHITTLNPGENTGPLHRHPQEELVIIKEGTIEVNIDGRKQVVGPGSIVFFAVNENENMTNVGKTPATYLVLQWFTPLTPKS
jgi:quercetin dioxygenase-like cupin family protein